MLLVMSIRLVAFYRLCKSVIALLVRAFSLVGLGSSDIFREDFIGMMGFFVTDAAYT